MANIRRIDGKRGVSYKITVTKGRDSTGKQIRHFLTWKPEPGMTNRQMEKEVQRAAFEFERQEIVRAFGRQNRSITLIPGGPREPM